MKLIENHVVVIEDDIEECIAFFDSQKDSAGWPMFFNVVFAVYANGKRRSSSLSLAGALEEEYSVRRRFPGAREIEIRLIRALDDDPCFMGAVVLPEFSYLTFQDSQTAVLDGIKWNMRF